MANRRIKPEIQAVFDRYVNNSQHVRRLERGEALTMLQKEFRLGLVDASEVFEYFDADQNGFLSLWEFQHFYTLAGNGAADTAARFEALDSEQNRYLTRAETEHALRALKSAEGRDLDDKDVSMILKSAKDADRILLGDFIALMYRVRLYRKGGR